MLRSNKKETRETGNQLLTIIGRGTEIEGNVTIQSSTRIDGKIKGDIKVREEIVLGPEGVVNGSISAKNASIGGKINGSVKCSDLLTLVHSANFEGDLVSSRLIIEEGAMFNGNSSIITK